MYRLRQQFDRNGFAVIEELLWPEECDELVEASYNLVDKLQEDYKEVFSTDKDRPFQTDYFLNSNDKIVPFYEAKALDQKGNLVVEPRFSVNKIGHALHLLHPLFRCYTYCSRVKNVAKNMLGLKEPAVVQSMVIFKNPDVSSEVQPHQDSTYLHTNPIPPVGFWIALEDATTANGCLWIAGGSHKTGTHRRLQRNPDPNSATKLIYDRPAPVYPASIFKPVPVKKGTCIILHGNVVHLSGINKTRSPRPAYTFHLIEKKDNSYSQDNWLQEGTAAPFDNMYSVQQVVYTNEEEKNQTVCEPKTTGLAGSLTLESEKSD